MPSASSCFLHVFGFRKIAQEKVPEKIRKIAKKYFATKEARSQKASTGGPAGGGRHPLARVGPGPRPRAAQGPRVAPWPGLLAPGFFLREIIFSDFLDFFRELFLCNFSETKNMQKTGTGTGHLVNRLVQENDLKRYKSCNKTCSNGAI